MFVHLACLLAWLVLVCLFVCLFVFGFDFDFGFVLAGLVVEIDIGLVVGGAPVVKMPLIFAVAVLVAVKVVAATAVPVDAVEMELNSEAMADLGTIHHVENQEGFVYHRGHHQHRFGDDLALQENLGHHCQCQPDWHSCCHDYQSACE